MRITIGSTVIITPRHLGGQSLIGEVTGVHEYPNGTCDYSVGCRKEQLLMWVNESRVEFIAGAPC